MLLNLRSAQVISAFVTAQSCINAEGVR